jgi:hypothetical protein
MMPIGSECSGRAGLIGYEAHPIGTAHTGEATQRRECGFGTLQRQGSGPDISWLTSFFGVRASLSITSMSIAKRV